MKRRFLHVFLLAVGWMGSMGALAGDLASFRHPWPTHQRDAQNTDFFPLAVGSMAIDVTA